ncbi:MAG: phosphotransferase [Chloroflexi bacterium]|nr:phosphotransferase [Chloroflexota bacterium]
MRTPPPISVNVIEAALRDAFAMKQPHLTFVRGGEEAWAFNVASAEGAFHLKIYSSADDLLLERLDACLALRTALDTASVVSAVPTRAGSLMFQVAGFNAALFPYVLAMPFRKPEWTQEQSTAVGRLLARIHAAPLDVPLVAESFSTGAADAAQKVIDALLAALESANPVHHATARLLLPCEGALRREIDRLRRASETVRHTPAAMVVCHGDLTWDNVLFGPEPYLIDWDDMLYAPKERDLMFYADPNDPVLEAYGQAGGDTRLDADALMYYRALWNNEEVADFGGRLLFGTHSAAQNDHDLAQLGNFLIYSGLDARAT